MKSAKEKFLDTCHDLAIGASAVWVFVGALSLVDVHPMVNVIVLAAGWTVGAAIIAGVSGMQVWKGGD